VASGEGLKERGGALFVVVITRRDLLSQSVEEEADDSVPGSFLPPCHMQHNTILAFILKHDAADNWEIIVLHH